MKIGDKIKIKLEVFATSQKSQKSLANKKGIIISKLDKVAGKNALEMYIVKVSGEELLFCSSEIELL